MDSNRTLENTLNELKISFGSYSLNNIIKIDENIGVLDVSDNENIDKQSNNSNNNSNFKTRLKSVRIKEKGDFYVLDKDGIIFNETINLVGILLDKDGVTKGYVYVLKNIFKKTSGALRELVSKSYGVIIYLLKEGYYICNDIDDEMIQSSCGEVDKGLELSGYIGDIVMLTFRNKRYRFSDNIWTENILNNKNKVYNNIGKFVEQ